MHTHVQVNDPRLSAFRNLRDERRLRAEGLFVAEGHLLVERLLLHPNLETVTILAQISALERVAHALGSEAEVLCLDASGMREVVGFPFHRGIMALGKRGRTQYRADLLPNHEPAFWLCLEEVTDPSNVGAIFRSARAFGCGRLFVGEGSADPWSRRALRASMGAVFDLPHAVDVPAVELATHAKMAGRIIGVLDPCGMTALRELHVNNAQQYLWFLGNEGAGLSENLRRAADVKVRIAMHPGSGVDSLNVAVTAGILLHALSGEF